MLMMTETGEVQSCWRCLRSIVKRRLKVNNPHSTRDNKRYMRLVLCGQLAEMNFADGVGLVTEANSNQIADVYNRSFTFIATGQSAGEGEKERSGSSSFFVYLPVSFSSVLWMSGGGVRRVDGLVVVVAGCCCSRGRLKMLLIAASVS